MTARLRYLLRVALLVSIIAAPLSGSDLYLTFANDPMAGNRRPDDLYTSDMMVDLHLSRARVTAGERMFTDREAGLRFDETHLSVEASVARIKDWDVAAGVGTLRVGRGLLGEDVQNQLHRLLFEDEVHLSYIEEDHEFMTASATAVRPLGTYRGAALATAVDAYTAPGFRSWIRGRVSVESRAGPVTAHASVGIRADSVQNDLLKPHIPGAGLHGSVGFDWRSLMVRWSFNQYGTETPHLSITFRTNFSSTALTASRPVAVASD